LPLSIDSSRCGKHILNEDPVALSRVIYQDMSHGTHKFAVLNNGAPAHG